MTTQHQKTYLKTQEFYKPSAPSIQTITGCSQEVVDTFWEMCENNLGIQKLYSTYTLKNCIECIGINPEIWKTFSYENQHYYLEKNKLRITIINSIS